MAYLINDTYLTEYTSVSTSKNAKDIKAALQLVTLIYMKPLLGIRLYDLYENHIKTKSTLSSQQDTLFASIQYYMALRVEREMMFNLLSISNKGVTEAEHVANMDTVKTLRQDADSKAEIIKKTILTYLNTNKESFPEYYPESSTDLKDKSSNYDFSAGVVFETEIKRFIQ